MEGVHEEGFRITRGSLFLAGPTLAADRAIKAPLYKALPMVVPTLGWSADNAVTNTGTDTGGGGLGAALAGNAIPGSAPLKYSGFLAGGQFGYNWQVRSWVYGLEADFDGSSAHGSTTAFYPAPALVPITTGYSRELDWLATVRGRVGLPSFLVYGTGGLAVGQTKVGSSVVAPAAASPPESEPRTNITSSNTSAGWTAGAGVEWMFAPQWSVKAEYLYVDLGNHSNTVTYAYGPNTSTMTSTVRDTDNMYAPASTITSETFCTRGTPGK
jgi:outer membrane immunogenic protein